VRRRESVDDAIIALWERGVRSVVQIAQELGVHERRVGRMRQAGVCHSLGTKSRTGIRGARVCSHSDHPPGARAPCD
jgi:hypothetical protein